MLGDTGDRWMWMKQTQSDLTDVTTDLNKTTFNSRPSLQPYFNHFPKDQDGDG